jgi:hypothetical protein
LRNLPFHYDRLDEKPKLLQNTIARSRQSIAPSER